MHLKRSVFAGIARHSKPHVVRYNNPTAEGTSARLESVATTRRAPGERLTAPLAGACRGRPFATALERTPRTNAVVNSCRIDDSIWNSTVTFHRLLFAALDGFVVEKLSATPAIWRHAAETRRGLHVNKPARMLGMFGYKRLCQRRDVDRLPWCFFMHKPPAPRELLIPAKECGFDVRAMPRAAP